MCTLYKFFTLCRLILASVNIKYIHVAFLNLPTSARLIMPYVVTAEWLGGLPIKRGVLSSNSDTVVIKHLLHAT